MQMLCAIFYQCQQNYDTFVLGHQTDNIEIEDRGGTQNTFQLFNDTKVPSQSFKPQQIIAAGSSRT